MTSTKSLKAQMAYTDLGSGKRGMQGMSPAMWPDSPYDAAAAAASFMQPPYGMPFGFPTASGWPYMDPAAAAAFGYDSRLMMGMPPPSPPGALDLPAMISVPSAVSAMDTMTPVAGGLRDEPPGLSLPAEVPEGKITRINWSVDIRNLGNSKKASSPAFQVPGASGSFRMALLPKGGASFVEAAMRGSVQVVREEISAVLPGFASMQISVTRVSKEAPAEEKTPPVGPFNHDFAMSNVFELPGEYGDFDLETIAGENKSVNICLEILPPDMAGVLQ